MVSIAVEKMWRECGAGWNRRYGMQECSTWNTPGGLRELFEGDVAVGGFGQRDVVGSGCRGGFGEGDEPAGGSYAWAGGGEG
jgi:hypothetical protein